MFSEIDNIYYINLDHRTDRNQEIQEEFRKMDIPHTKIERFPAIYHREIGAVGCGRSHIAVLRDAIKKRYEQIMVFEDDFMFCISKEEFQQQMENLKTMEYDVCMLSYFLQDSEPTDNPNFLRVLEAQTVSGYIVKRHCFEPLIKVYEWGVENFEKTNYHWLYAIDVVWKPLQREQKWICFHPRAGKQRLSYSDCSNTMNDIEW